MLAADTYRRQPTPLIGQISAPVTSQTWGSALAIVFRFSLANRRRRCAPVGTYETNWKSVRKEREREKEREKERIAAMMFGIMTTFLEVKSIHCRLSILAQLMTSKMIPMTILVDRNSYPHWRSIRNELGIELKILALY